MSTPMIYQLPTLLSGTPGVSPNFKYMVTGNNLSSITTPGYLNQVDLQSNPVSTTDVLQILYDFDLQTQVGSYGSFTVSISNGIITLVQTVSPGDVQLPVTSGHFANFIGTSGKIGDDGYVPSTSSPGYVPIATGVIAANNIPIFQDTFGTLGASDGLNFFDTTNTLRVGENGSAQAGKVRLVPNGTNQGNFDLVSVPISGNYTASIENTNIGQSTIYELPDPSSATTTICVNLGGGIRNGTPKLYASQLSGTAQSIPPNTYTLVTLDSTTIDTNSALSSNVYEILFTGLYLVSYQINLNITMGDTAMSLLGNVYVDGVSSPYLINNGYFSVDTFFATAQATGIIGLNEGQNVSLYVQHNGGTARTINSGGSIGNTFLSLSLIV